MHTSTRSIRVTACAIAALAAPNTASAQTFSNATAAGASGFSVRPGLEVFAQYSLRVTNALDGSAPWTHAFDVPRVHASLEGSYGVARARVVLEGVRSAADGALIGVAGDSLVLRLREAFVAARPAPWIDLRAGVIPTLTTAELEGTWRLRAVAATPLETTHLATPADLGATAHVALPGTLGTVSLGAFNGEGYTARELNRGKSVELAAALHPIAAPAARAITLFASYIVGSTGTGSARADRLTGALLWQGARIRGGVAFTYAWGVDDNGARESTLLDAFVRVEPVARLIFGARVSRWQRNVADDADRVTTLLGTAGYRWIDPLETFVAVERSIPGARAQDALPGADFWDLRLVARAAF